MTQTESATAREPQEVLVRRMQPSERPAVVSVMARAFDDDPFANWIVAQDKRRARRIYDFMDAGMRLSEPHNEVYTTEGVEGGALWSPPGKWKTGILDQVRLLPLMVRATGLRNLAGRFGGFNMVEKHHPNEPHWYLLALGVEPDLQGRGIGSKLMAPVLEMCDRDRTPAYLESSKERNVPLYERHGFKVTERLELPKGGPPIWLMWRDPQ